MKPRLIILTGPQGSGNHMWSKIFALHHDVNGWNALLDTEWIGHKDEPFNRFWTDLSSFKYYIWNGNWYVTSISCPYQVDGELITPDYKKFTEEAKKHFDIQFVVLGRDQNILEKQERRIRGSKTYDLMQKELVWIVDNYTTHFASMELFHLYKQQYLKELSSQLDFPIASKDSRLDAIIQEDANKKYIQPLHIVVGKYDKQARESSGLDER